MGDSPSYGRSARLVADLVADRSTVTSAPGRLIATAQRILRMERRVQRQLPGELAQHVRVANVSGDQLVLATSSATFATQLRMLSRELLSALAADADGDAPARLTIKVMPDVFPPPQPTPRRPKKLSAAALTALQRIADSSGSASLRATVERLARQASGE